LNLDSNEGPNKNILGSKGAYSIREYFINKRNSCTLNYLYLKGCSLANEGVIILSEGLRCNQSLIGLNLRGNLFNKKGLIYLIKRAPRSLKELDISDNEIKDKGIIAFSEILFNHNNINFNSDSEDEIVRENSP